MATMGNENWRENFNRNSVVLSDGLNKLIYYNPGCGEHSGKEFAPNPTDARIKLNIDESAIQSIAKKCIEMKVGARGLRAELENVLLKTQFVLPDLATENVTKVTITEESVTQGKEPLLVYGNKRKKTREQNSL
jgi:hypothetical protein